jgi:hypothetical protein
MARTHRFGRLVTLAVLFGSACGPGAGGTRAPAAAPAPLDGDHPGTFIFANEMGQGFRLEHLDVGIDGRRLFTKASDTGLAEERQLLLARDLPLPAGAHVLLVQLTLRGHGEGVFSYLKGYTFKVRSSHTFWVKPGLVVATHARERPGVPLEQRPFVHFEEALRLDR